jgi:hypothetical protein
MWRTLEALGYDRDFFSIKSRCFIMTLHCDSPIHISVRDATFSNIDKITTNLLLQKFGVQSSK